MTDKITSAISLAKQHFYTDVIVDGHHFQWPISEIKVQLNETIKVYEVDSCGVPTQTFNRPTGNILKQAKSWLGIDRFHVNWDNGKKGLCEANDLIVIV